MPGRTDADDISGTIGRRYRNTPPGERLRRNRHGWKNTILAGGDVEGTFPVYDDAGGNRANGGWFHIRGYATFRLIGWRFAGSGSTEVFRSRYPDVSAANACNKPCRGIIGQFVRFESIDSAGGPGGTGADLGSVEIRLIK